ncbi:diphthine synthase [bacterium]|nr:diphthine synthase [bacterium]
MLHIIGIGAKIKHINFEMFELIKLSEKVYLEYYTSFYQDSFEDLEKFLEKKVEILNREKVEVEIDELILSEAKEKDIAFLVLGDPLIATTHTDLILRAKKRKIPCKVYNNVSIANFITRTGLQFYKFGKISSIPFFSDKFKPRTPYIIYLDNFKMGAHSLFLLDLNPSNDFAYKGNEKYLKAGIALEYLLELPKLMLDNEDIEEKDALALDGETMALICSRLGFDDEEIVYDTIDNLIKMDKTRNFKEPLCLIIPGDLHEMEKDFLMQFSL